MEPVVIINGEEKSNISIFNRNMQYGDGLFETCVAKDNKILFWESHVARLKNGCERLNIKKIANSVWLEDIKKALSLSSEKDCIIKLILSRGNSLRGYSYSEDIEPVRVVIASQISEYKTKDSFSLEYASCGFHSNPNLAGIKHCNRLEQIMARTNMLADEAIMLDENKSIISVTQGNIYFIFGNKLVTPKLERCGVMGSRRSIILELSRIINLEVDEDTISIEQVEKANEVFVSNSLIGIQPVTSIGSYNLNNNPLTKEIKAAFKSTTQDIKSWTCL
ncbi:MAG: aminodeoxychorismate lyase [Thiotrichales bacterium]|jgi:4-amino-4-deoxychorismate lyase|nr:aminodeoxychorismate lyase [Thiotrichales bacterium]MBT3854969.1 aminodeoxychorismate lyase [Thiotrichales bacterium]MBT4653949.1 aminodeoxychorismate lyase [Thiotrichales bacterium]MBT5500282.1 aminodeoxychorismate lyase [Thiotrichales bacterium]MBT5984807.1 aminodeoxychorismate lyase [Thiotrichales bacterium]